MIIQMLKQLSDLMVVALTIFMEARGEPYAGKVMVGEVIAVRAQQSGKSLRDVCLAPNQFTCWNTDQFQIIPKKGQAWRDSMYIARCITVPGYIPNSPATHYLNPKKASKKTIKRWEKKMRVVARVGNHVFYVEKKPMTQPDLFDQTADQKFDQWVHSPEGGMVANWFIRMGLRAQKAGLKHYGAKGIAEVLRWKFALAKMDGEIFKINNNYVSRLARFAEERCPELKGLFEHRELKS